MTTRSGQAAPPQDRRFVRAVVALIAAVVGYISVVSTLGGFMQATGPQGSFGLVPSDGRTLAAVSERLSSPDAEGNVPDEATRDRADRMAREALRRDPTGVAALATLGLDAELRGNTAAAHRFFRYSDRLSRRDLRTRLWMVEYAVAHGDIAGALRSYDIALRTARGAPDLLFPILTAAIASPAIRTGLGDTLIAGPPWGPAFVAYAGRDHAAPRATADLFLRLRRAGYPIEPSTSNALIDTLVGQRLAGDAWRYYAALHPGADRRYSRDRFFTAGPTGSSFDWKTFDDAGLSASILPNGRAGVVDFSVSPNTGGTLVEQRQLLPPQAYVVSGVSAEIDQPDGSSPAWVLTCQDGRELGRIAVPNSANNAGIFAGRVDVPADCPAQTLSLIATPTDSLSGVTGRIKQLWLRPANRRSD